MPHTLLRTFNNLPEAQRAAAHLLDAGFASASVHIEPRLDEAGATESNFAVGNPESGRGFFHGSSISVDDKEYRRDFAAPDWSGTILLMVDLQNAAEEEKADTLLHGLGTNPGRPAS